MELNYKFLYANFYEYISKCDDCGIINFLENKEACTDYHTSGYNCCNKNICTDGCIYKCDQCFESNQIYEKDGYIEKFKCWNCQTLTDVVIIWFGMSIMEACKRYCGCSLNSWDGVCQGYKIKRDLFQIIEYKQNVLDELKNRNKRQMITLIINGNNYQIKYNKN